MIPFYILLLDVRLAARRRSRVGGRRHAGAWLPARRHGRPHYAQRRRACSTRTAIATARVYDPELRLLRPDLCVRSRRHHPGWPAPHVQGSGGRLLLHHADERKLSAPGNAEGRRGRHPTRHVSVSRLQAKKKGPRVQLLGSGTILREVIAAADLLEKDFGVAADVWSCPSFNELRRDGIDVERWNLLHPAQAPRKQLCRGMPCGHAGPRCRCDRLYARLCRTDSAICAVSLSVSRHRWLRPQRLSGSATQILRGRTVTTSRSQP